MTVRGQCTDAVAGACYDPGGDHETRADYLAANCNCAVEQHYVYRWDELGRISEARRYDRLSGHDSDPWSLEVRQRYLYDANNVRTVKETRDSFSGPTSLGTARAALYPFPGDFERRGLEAGGVMGDEWVPASTGNTETQYVIAGARLVWKYDRAVTGTRGSAEVRGDARFTYAVTDLIQSISLNIDLFTGTVLEASTCYPNGARETRRRNDDVPIAEQYALEPMGFTGKEDDSEVGLVYFGERYLMPHVGRWASPDPLHVHASGGGEFGNSYHYVSGNLLQARDPLGLADPDVAAAMATLEASDAALDQARIDHDRGTGSQRDVIRARAQVQNAQRQLVAARWEPSISVRIRVPGSDSPESPSDHDMDVNVFERTAGHAYVTFHMPGGEEESWGWWPSGQTPETNAEYVNGIPGEVRSESGDDYSFSTVRFRVSEERFWAALEYARDPRSWLARRAEGEALASVVPRADLDHLDEWGASNFCTDHAVRALRIAGVNELNDLGMRHLQNRVYVYLDFVARFPGQLAADIYNTRRGGKNRLGDYRATTE